MGVFTLLVVFFAISSVNLSWGWCLRSLGVKECDFELLHVSLYNLRAFLSIRSNVGGATLVETAWPEVLPSVARRFPSSQKNCQEVAQSWRTAVDPQGRLWVVDKGTRTCKPKIIIFNLKSPWNTVVHRHVFPNATEGIFTSITIDTVAHGRSTRAYLTVGRSNCIVVYSLEEKKFWMLCTRSEDASPHFSHSVITPSGLLYLYDSSQNVLHTADVKGLRKMKFKEHEAILLETQKIGGFMGQGHSLIMDTNNSLHYIIPRFGVVVKWDTRLPLVAENQQILHMQSAEMIGLLFSIQESLWIINAAPIGEKHTLRIN